MHNPGGGKWQSNGMVDDDVDVCGYRGDHDDDDGDDAEMITKHITTTATIMMV